MEFYSTSPYSHIQIIMLALEVILSPYKLPQPRSSVRGKRCEFYFDVFGFVAKKLVSQKSTSFWLKFVTHILQS